MILDRGFQLVIPVDSLLFRDFTLQKIYSISLQVVLKVN